MVSVTLWIRGFVPPPQKKSRSGHGSNIVIVPHTGNRNHIVDPVA